MDLDDDDIEFIGFVRPPLPAEENEPEPLPLDPLLVAPVFELPDHIIRRMRVDEIAVVEYAVQYYREDIVRGLDEFSVRRLQEIVDNIQREYARNRRGEERVERPRREQGERDVRLNQYIRLMEDTRRAFQETIRPRRMPESPNLYTPKDGKFHWRIWDDVHVMNWVKQFIFNEDHLTMIQCRQFIGPTLNTFLNSNTGWKQANWPFGLFIRLRSHFNRVVNARNGYQYEIN